MRPIFRSLGDIAQATGCAIVLIGHLNKAAGTQSTYPVSYTHLSRSRYGNEKEGGYTIMKVLMVEPGKSPYAAEIESGLKSLQAAVGGDIQAVYPYEDPVALICNEEGKLLGLPLNRALFDDDDHIYDICLLYTSRCV